MASETNARYLAYLLRLGILPTGTILPMKHREVRDLECKRMQLVRSHTRHILAVENTTARQSGTRITSNHPIDSLLPLSRGSFEMNPYRCELTRETEAHETGDISRWGEHGTMPVTGGYFIEQDLAILNGNASEVHSDQRVLLCVQHRGPDQPRSMVGVKKYRSGPPTTAGM